MTAHASDVRAVQQIKAIAMILDTVCRLTDMGFAAVARVTDERWIACSVRDEIAFGLTPGDELPFKSTICDAIRQTGDPVIVSDVETDDVYRSHIAPMTYGFRSYVSVPIVLADGSFFGTLCAIDPQPRDLDRVEIRDMFRLFADLIGHQLDANDRLETSQSRLATEIETGELRDQFIAVLGHDLRNPLAAVHAGVAMLGKAPDAARTSLILREMQGSIGRMTGMIDDILDFALGRLGGGIPLERRAVDVAALVRRVVHGLKAAYPDRKIVMDGCVLPSPAQCDARRIEQMLANLIGNALSHGAPDEPITVDCDRWGGNVLLSVINGGDSIPEAARDKLFHPFFRAYDGNGREGLGLGLYIASQIAKAHGGQIELASSGEETRFVATIPAIAS